MQPAQILVAEDDGFSQMIVTRLINSLGRNAVIAADGDIAIRTFQENPGNFSLILLDLQMPKVDGFEAARKIREVERTMGLYPIKMFGLSADDDDVAKANCIDSGMNGLIVKPLKKDILLELIETL